MTAPVPTNRPDRWCAQYLFAYDIDDAKLERPVRACLEQRRFLAGGELLLVASATAPMISQPGSYWRSPWAAAGKNGRWDLGSCGCGWDLEDDERRASHPGFQH